ncbi:dipeptidase [Limnovirga soli]|uniref:Membrane dipeptidase n=1 Tax=Limnovirga soli TaxID=2656915 RepID=A0A8J8F9T2_9BACT|nr:dipeptidase [Limnovirga soli]NNV54135.1 membrane dipeptidase [Limnovirga soli]
MKLPIHSRLFISCCILVLFLLHTATAQTQSYKKIHNKAIVVDTHNDALSTLIGNGYSFDQHLDGKTHSDVYRMKKGGIDVQIFSIFCGGEQKDPYNFANREIDTLYATVARNPNNMMIVKTPDQLQQAVAGKKLAAMMGVEGGHMIENSLDKLDSLFNRGVRYMTLTWNNSNPWATSAMEETYDTLLHQPKGLSSFGKQVVHRMNALGMLVDLSHVGEKTFWDAINTTTKPVIVSHSCVYNLCPAFRNLKDDQIKAIGKNGGVIHLNFYSGFLDGNYHKKSDAFTQRHKAETDSLLAVMKESYLVEEYMFKKYAAETNEIRAPFNLLFDHLDYIVKLIGVDHVGLGSDFDGIESPPQQLDDVTKFPLITKELLRRGYSKQDVYKILGGNFIRIFEANSL